MGKKKYMKRNVAKENTWMENQHKKILNPVCHLKNANATKIRYCKTKQAKPQGDTGAPLPCWWDTNCGVQRHWTAPYKGNMSVQAIQKPHHRHWPKKNEGSHAWNPARKRYGSTARNCPKMDAALMSFSWRCSQVKRDALVSHKTIRRRVGSQYCRLCDSIDMTWHGKTEGRRQTRGYQDGLRGSIAKGWGGVCLSVKTAVGNVSKPREHLLHIINSKHYYMWIF